MLAVLYDCTGLENACDAFDANVKAMKEQKSGNGRGASRTNDRLVPTSHWRTPIVQNVQVEIEQSDGYNGPRIMSNKVKDYNNRLSAQMTPHKVKNLLRAYVRQTPVIVSSTHGLMKRAVGPNINVNIVVCGAPDVGKSTYCELALRGNLVFESWCGKLDEASPPWCKGLGRYAVEHERKVIQRAVLSATVNKAQVHLVLWEHGSVPVMHSSKHETAELDDGCFHDFKILAPTVVYPATDAFLLFYNVHKRRTLTALIEQAAEIRSLCPDPIIIVVGNSASYMGSNYDDDGPLWLDQHREEVSEVLDTINAAAYVETHSDTSHAANTEALHVLHTALNHVFDGLAEIPDSWLKRKPGCAPSNSDPSEKCLLS
eukprot:TRINITY_DN1409_c4_g1_i1.p1 TRINITY_DN1409_c4_g1~~TRINITY_DN1409_c4_g1_i1.p1  ORF type:complete len:372 (-),score=32.93 TRINITY_DN1409_c4_g1_i1:59-1174(-)